MSWQGSKGLIGNFVDLGGFLLGGSRVLRPKFEHPECTRYSQRTADRFMMHLLFEMHQERESKTAVPAGGSSVTELAIRRGV
jgi:hypothetical protein